MGGRGVSEQCARPVQYQHCLSAGVRAVHSGECPAAADGRYPRIISLVEQMAASPTAASSSTAASVQFLARRAGKRAEEAFERSREIPGEIVTDFLSHLRNAPCGTAQQALGAPHAVYVDVLADGLAEELPKTLIELVLIDADAASKRMQRGRIDERAFD